MLAHLAGVANFVIPFAGLVGSIVVYSLRSYVPLERENARAAINFAITELIALAILFGFAFTVLLTLMMQSVATPTPHSPSLALFAGYFIVFGSIFAVMLGGAIMNAVGARAAYLGRVFRYPLSIEFVRERGTPVASSNAP